MNTEVKNVISASQQDAQYDEKAKRILGNKNILAHILVNTIDEFRDMKPQEVVAYIEGDPLIGIVPVEPGMTNAKKGARGQRTVGMNTENSEINEGVIRFDIIFYVRMKDGLSQIIVNVDYSDFGIIPIVSCFSFLCLHFSVKNRNNSCA